MPFNRKLCPGLFLLFALATSGSAQTDRLRVRLLDAKSGNPLSGQHMLIFFGDPTDQAQTETKDAEAMTGSDGFCDVIRTGGSRQVRPCFPRREINLHRAP